MRPDHALSYAQAGPQPALVPRARSAAASGDRQLLLRYHRDGDLAAREQLVVRFLPLARRLARRYQGGGEPLEDLVQVASLGLVEAIDRFDPARATAFSSFAVPTIVGELKRHFRDKGWSVRVPRDLQDLAVKLRRLTEDRSRALGRAPTAAELAADAGVGVERVLEALEAGAAHRAVSLDAARTDDDDTESLTDVLGVEDRGYRVAEAGATVQRLVCVLSDRDREVLRLRSEEDLTQSEIGARVGISQMHVSRVIRRSIVRLRVEANAPGARTAAGRHPVGHGAGS